MISCSNPDMVVQHKSYFDLTAFFDEQVNTLYRDSMIVLKTTSINNSMDQHEMPWTDWRKEFALFYGSDINKAAFAGKYEVDTVTEGSSVKKIVYTSTDPDLKTKKLEVTVTGPADEVTLIHIVNQSVNAVTTNSEELYYETEKVYIIRTKRKMILFGETTFAVKGDFVRKKPAYF